MKGLYQDLVDLSEQGDQLRIDAGTAPGAPGGPVDPLHAIIRDGKGGPRGCLRAPAALTATTWAVRYHKRALCRMEVILSPCLPRVASVGTDRSTGEEGHDRVSKARFLPLKLVRPNPTPVCDPVTPSRGSGALLAGVIFRRS